MHPLLHETLVCPQCHGSLQPREGALACAGCAVLFSPNRFGYLEFLLDPRYATLETTTEEYASIQEQATRRFYHDYLQPYIQREPSQRILDVGSGVGRIISLLVEAGYEAYGVDLPCLAPYWAQAGNEPNIYFCCEATHLPFRDDYFDMVYSLGVIEHVGLGRGEDRWQARQRYANELLRVTRPGGRLLLSSPNKSFPIDVQHGPEEANGWRQRIWEKARIHLHPVWGDNTLLSYGEVEQLFLGGGARRLTPLPLRDFFGFASFRRGPLRWTRPLAGAYVNHLPAFLRATGLNPYLLVEIRK